MHHVDALSPWMVRGRRGNGIAVPGRSQFGHLFPRGQIPYVHGAQQIGTNRILSGGINLDLVDSCRTAIQQPDALSGLNVPEANGLVLASTEHVVAIWVKDHRMNAIGGMTGEETNRNGSVGGPQSHRGIGASRSKVVSRGRERNGPDWCIRCVSTIHSQSGTTCVRIGFGSYTVHAHVGFLFQVFGCLCQYLLRCRSGDQWLLHGRRSHHGNPYHRPGGAKYARRLNDLSEWSLRR
mmetsp:Transcript_8994/g.26729  ORF Transcript_8994/g.26729 Transcript_8994/m.26729 type:complete len:237 (+) Transcript_8994:398-1108(+)